ncbi:unnamed protein product [Calypogeia fissa]
MSYKLNLDLGTDPGSHMIVSCTNCKDYPQDDSGSGAIGNEQGLPALRPNVAIIIIGLGFTLVVVVAFAVFAKFMRPHMNRQNTSNNNNTSGGHSRLWEDVVKDGAPVDAKAIKSLPLVLYLAESFQGLKLDLDCAVCLSQFEEGEELRLLPSCKHMFHPACIDGWLKSHPFCPLCRSNVLSSSTTSWDVHSQQETTPLRSFQAADSVAAHQESPSTVMIESSEEQQLQLSQPQEPPPHVEISVLERFEARFEALRGRCYGKKGKNYNGSSAAAAPEPLPREGYLNSELEKFDVMCRDSSAFASTLVGQGSNTAAAASKFPKSENCGHVPSSTHCISIVEPDVQERLLCGD